MAGSLNRVTLIGNLGKDPEIRKTQGGNSCANFSIATSKQWRDKQTGERKESTQWHNVVVWSEGLVKVVEQYVKKGTKVLVEGELQTRKWQDKNGNDRWSTEIVLQGYDAKLLLLGGNGNGDSGNRRSDASGSRDYGGGRSSGGAPSNNYSNSDIDEDIPF